LENIFEEVSKKVAVIDKKRMIFRKVETINY
jgi:hypothetical protein